LLRRHEECFLAMTENFWCLKRKYRMGIIQILSAQHFINGALCKPVNGKTFAVVSPATGVKVADAAAGDVEDVRVAVAAGKAAQKEWAKLTPRERGALIGRCAVKLEEHAEDLAQIMCAETGKAICTECRPETKALVDTFIFYAGLGSEIKGQTVPQHADMLTMTLRQPIGVVGAIIPWNVPLLMVALKVCPALVAGNTVVVKSAEEAPLAVLRVAQLCGEILPKGVFNMLSGFGEDCGAPLAQHPDIGKITFTGSVETGKIVAHYAAEKMIPATMELGGKSPMIVMEDADMERAVQGAVGGMRFTRCGQSCSAASRIFVQSTVYDVFVAKLKAAVDALVMGDPMDEKTDIGSIISKQQFEKVKFYIAEGEKAGGTALRCSKLPTDEKLKDGMFVQPVLFTGLDNTSKLAREEIFGPVTCIIKFESYEEALAAANDTSFGLAATIWTKDLKTALDAAHRLEAGFVQVNQNLVVQAGLPYGGFKQSGLGKEATLEAMLEHFTRSKTVMVSMG
jgi:acyl-CoA reductase-like NAD-dependent aldehyde dehydrogenase